MFFLRRAEPLVLAETDLMAMRLSLNTPVISSQDLPMGPARAAILCHLEIDTSPNVTIGVRSLKTGEVVLFSFDGDLNEESSTAVGIDAALSFGESMGFLFDEDEMADGDPVARAGAYGLWVELMGGGTAPLVDAPADAPAELGDSVEIDLSEEVVFGPTPNYRSDGDDEDEGFDAADASYDSDVELDDVDRELLLDEEAALDDSFPNVESDVELDLEEVVPEPSEPLVDVPEAVVDQVADRALPPIVREVADDLPAMGVAANDDDGPPGLTLSKFRTSAEPPAAPPEVERRARVERRKPPVEGDRRKKAALGRLKLVKRRRSGGTTEEGPSWLFRLLSSF